MAARGVTKRVCTFVARAGSRTKQSAVDCVLQMQRRAENTAYGTECEEQVRAWFDARTPPTNEHAQRAIRWFTDQNVVITSFQHEVKSTVKTFRMYKSHIDMIATVPWSKEQLLIEFKTVRHATVAQFLERWTNPYVCSRVFKKEYYPSFEESRPVTEHNKYVDQIQGYAQLFAAQEKYPDGKEMNIAIIAVCADGVLYYPITKYIYNSMRGYNNPDKSPSTRALKKDRSATYPKKRTLCSTVSSSLPIPAGLLPPPQIQRKRKRAATTTTTTTTTTKKTPAAEKRPRAKPPKTIGQPILIE